MSNIPMKNSWVLDQDVLYFLEIIKAKSLTQAAEKLGVNQPALSKAISRLEKKWGSSLVLRSREGISLSLQGEVFASKIQLLLNQFEAESSLELPHSVRFGCHEALANTYLPKFLPTFSQQFPEVKFECIFAPSLEITRLVNKGELDLGIVINPLKNADLTFKTITQETVGIFSFDPKLNHEHTLVHPDMIMLEGFMRKKHVTNILKIPSYETIALILSKNPQWSGLLPQPIAERHQLKMVGTKLFEVQVNMVMRKDRLSLTLQHKLFKLIKDI